MTTDPAATADRGTIARKILDIAAETARDHALHGEKGTDLRDAPKHLLCVDVARGLFFSHTMLALDAACEGQGVALAPLPMAERELARGTLAVADPRGYAPGTGIWLAWPRKGLRTLSPAATAFRDWVIEEARAVSPPARKVPRARRGAP